MSVLLYRQQDTTLPGGFPSTPTPKQTHICSTRWGGWAQCVLTAEEAERGRRLLRLGQYPAVASQHPLAQIRIGPGNGLDEDLIQVAEAIAQVGIDP